jgi:hypothetical protein
LVSKDLKVESANGTIAIRDNGAPWASEKEMQTRVSHWLRDQERKASIGAGTTLHGLRVSYAEWWIAQRRIECRGSRADRRQIGADGRALHPPRRV